MKNKIIVSRCFTGENVTWKGSNNKLNIEWLNSLARKNSLIIVCPEMMGGLSVPREPAERQLNGQIMTISGENVSAQFESGARQVVKLALNNNCIAALLKAKSPSCGNQMIYNGSFDGTLVTGEGETAKQLREVGVTVFNEYQIDQLEDFYKKSLE